jgi:hypothetical protein
MISFAIPAVWAGVNFSNPAMRTGTSLPANSICGGRPGLKIKSLTLSEARSISRKIETKFNGGGVGGWLVTVWCSLLIFDSGTFAVLARQKIARDQKIALKNKLLWFDVHPSRRYSTGAVNRNLDRVPK